MRVLQRMFLAILTALLVDCDTSGPPTPLPVATPTLAPTAAPATPPAPIPTPTSNLVTVTVIPESTDDGHRHHQPPPQPVKTAAPTAVPTVAATAVPTLAPTKAPTPLATSTVAPTKSPLPTTAPTPVRTVSPIATPTPVVVVIAPPPVVLPTIAPTPVASASPVSFPKGRWATAYGEYDCQTATQWTAAQWAVIRKYIDVTDRQCIQNIAAAHLTGMTSGEYTDPSLPCTATATTNCYYFNEASNYSTGSWARTCDGSQIFYGDPSDGHNTFTDPRSTTLAGDLNRYTVTAYKAAGGDFILVDNIWLRTPDDEHISMPGGPALPNGSAAYCGYTDAEFIADEGTLFDQFALPVMFNGDTTPALATITSHKNVEYGMCEDCISFGFNEANDPGRLTERPPFWQQELDAALVTENNGKNFLVFSHGYNEPKDDPIQTYLLASLMLVYSDGHTGLMMDGSTPSGVNVPPEIFFVPAQPLTPTASLTDIEQLDTNDVYVREFASCGLYGVNIGPCAAIVNPDPNSSHPLPALHQVYAGTLGIDNWCGTATPTNLGGSYCYKGAITELGDNGKVYIAGGNSLKTGSSIPAATAVILTGSGPSGFRFPHRTLRQFK